MAVILDQSRPAPVSSMFQNAYTQGMETARQARTQRLASLQSMLENNPGMSPGMQTRIRDDIMGIASYGRRGMMDYASPELRDKWNDAQARAREQRNRPTNFAPREKPPEGGTPEGPDPRGGPEEGSEEMRRYSKEQGSYAQRMREKLKSEGRQAPEGRSWDEVSDYELMDMIAEDDEKKYRWVKQNKDSETDMRIKDLMADQMKWSDGPKGEPSPDAVKEVKERVSQSEKADQAIQKVKDTPAGKSPGAQEVRAVEQERKKVTQDLRDLEKALIRQTQSVEKGMEEENLLAQVKSKQKEINNNIRRAKTPQEKALMVEQGKVEMKELWEANGRKVQGQMNPALYAKFGMMYGTGGGGARGTGGGEHEEYKLNAVVDGQRQQLAFSAPEGANDDVKAAALYDWMKKTGKVPDGIREDAPSLEALDKESRETIYTYASLANKSKRRDLEGSGKQMTSKEIMEQTGMEPNRRIVLNAYGSWGLDNAAQNELRTIWSNPHIKLLESGDAVIIQHKPEGMSPREVKENRNKIIEHFDYLEPHADNKEEMADHGLVGNPDVEQVRGGGISARINTGSGIKLAGEKYSPTSENPLDN